MFATLDHLSPIMLVFLHEILLSTFLLVQTENLHKPQFEASFRKAKYQNNDKICFPFTAAWRGGSSKGEKLFFRVLHWIVLVVSISQYSGQREKSQQRHCDMRRHLELCSTLNSSFFYGIWMLNTDPSLLWQIRFNWWALLMRDWYPYYLWLQNMTSSYFLSSHLQLLVFSLHLRLRVHKVLPPFAFQLRKATLLKIPEGCLSYSMSPWNKCQRNVGLFMYLLGLCYISEEALWHLVITSLEDITQGNSTVKISKEFQCFPQYDKSV